MEKVTAREVDKLLQNYLRSRPDLGFWKAVRAAVLKTPNPFEAASAPRSRPWFVLFLIFTMALIAVFAYFNFLT